LTANLEAGNEETGAQFRTPVSSRARSSTGHTSLGQVTLHISIVLLANIPA